MTSMNPEWLRAREIMGRNFFGIEEAVKHYGVKPTKEDLAALEHLPFSEETLEACKDTHVLIAVFSLSIFDIRRKAKKHFHQQNWYNNEKFTKDRGTVSWHLVKKTPVEDSRSKTFEEQKLLLGHNDEVPTARVMTHTVIGHVLSTGECLFEKCYVRTSDVASVGSRVDVGYFDSVGLNIGNDWGDDWCVDIGLVSARKSDA